MRYIIAIVLCASLCACATPVTMLKNDQTGQVARCGGGVAGSVAGGLIGYSIEKDSDSKCIADYEAQGFKRL